VRDALICALGLGGWCAITYALASLTTPLLWPLSLGLLLLGVIGVRKVGHILWHGVTTFLPAERGKE
jgi:hypothetical protein